MLNEKQLSEIRAHLGRAQNPIFYYDNDADGLCSYVILSRFLGRGKGVAVRSFPDLDRGYARKAKELGADYVFVLDKPSLSREFLEEIKVMGLPLIWIDHHDVPVEDFVLKFDNVFSYNPAKNSEKSEEPTTYLSYKIANRKGDIWMAVVGCIADHFLPEFADEFAEKFPDFWAKEISEPFQAYFGTEIGRIARALNFGLKDSITNVVRLQKFLLACESPADVFSEVPANYSFRKKFRDVEKKYSALLERAKCEVGGKVLFFQYGGNLSISSDLSNELSFLYPEKYVVVAFRKGNVVNLSLRGENVKKILGSVFSELAGSGGGHDNAVGARISASDLEEFRKIFERKVLKR